MPETKIETERTPENCGSFLLPIKDALDVLNGKWRLLIIGSLTFGNKRFRELARGIPGITDKMLSKELKDLEMNKLIKRTVHDSYSPVVEYSITEHGRTLHAAFQELHRWGSEHRKKIIG